MNRTRVSGVAAGLGAMVMVAQPGFGQSAEIQVSSPGGASSQPVTITATVRWSGAAVLAGLKGSIVVTSNDGSAQNFTSQFASGALVSLGSFVGMSRVGMSMLNTPPMFTGGMAIPPWYNSSGITIAQYQVTVNQPGIYSARWVPEPGWEQVVVFPTGASTMYVPVPTANISTVFYVGGCCFTPCRPDLTGSAVVGQAGYSVPNLVLNNDDFFYYLARFAVGDRGVCDMTASGIPGSPGYGFPNGILNNDDFFYYLGLFAQGC